MPDPVSSETIDSLAAKLADFADTLSDAERDAFDQFFLQPADVEGFVFGPGTVLKPEGPPITPGAAGTGLVGSRADYLRKRLENAMISGF